MRGQTIVSYKPQNQCNKTAHSIFIFKNEQK